ncbi:sugar kinase [candidate division KSB1 bacterium]|nr:sugar kinase [candidate division KSB1 bacterium]
MSVLVVGSAALDSIETPFGKADDALGGSAIYFSSSASFFTSVNMVAVVGNDFPLDKIQYLTNRGVDLSGLSIDEGKTFRWGGRYNLDLNDRETLYTHLNVFENFKPVLPEHYKSTPYVFLANIQPQLQLDVLNQMHKPKLVVLDTMNFWIERTLDDLKKTLRYVDILIINDSETRQLSGEYNLFKAARIIQSMGPKTLVLKKGEHGAMLITEDDYFWAPAYPLETLFDPTGAGDTFAGGFLGYLAETDDVSVQNLRKAVIYGSTLASFCVEKFSVQRLIELTKDEIIDRYNQFIRLTKFE